ncbi:spore germination protein [Anaerovorax odorimutans]|uniref:spore germination protein n=1 Tax=Anaerovorax odorimutans TaxID=109327 RepID=UPI0004266DD6|nr:spore germination protein [Anaerovorax odorimutans]
MENKFKEYVGKIREILPIGRTFDMVERNLLIGGKECNMYFLQALVKDDVMERIITGFFTIAKIQMDQYTCAMDFIKSEIPYIGITRETDINNIVTSILSGQTVMVVDGFSEAIVMDLRTYPVRSVSEPDKEKSLRGAKDGFVETLLFNTALIRRRVRDPNLVFKIFNVGEKTKTDVSIGYIEGLADDKQLEKITDKIKGLKVKSLTVGDQSLVEAIGKSSSINPFPKVRYTQRPDVVCAHLTEGKFVILVDNSPTAIMLPTCIFDFNQDVDDYYLPFMTGNYFRLIRTINMISILLLTPIYLLIAEGNIPVTAQLKFMIPDEGYSIPLFLQFIILEFAIDALKLASLSTPNSLGMSLSVIGALILGEFSISAGWFIPQTILCMAVVALASFTQSSMELGYAIKFMRILILIGVAIFGIWGGLAALAFNLILLASTKSLVGTSYLYPLIPFNWYELKHLLFRTRS